MPDSQYGNSQTPSSRPPEPPYRVSAQASSQYAGQPDLRGIDTTGEVPSTGRYAPVSSDAATESFQEARFGDTATMPLTSSGSASESASYTSQATPQYVHQQAAAQPVAQKTSAGKTFLFGFLGALVACALALGGYTLWNNANSSNAVSSTTIGTTGQSVINAAEEGQTLAEAVAAKSLPSVVGVYNYQRASSYGYGFGYGADASGSSDELTQSNMGSGVIISDDGYIITNYHVVEDAAKITVTVNGTERDAEYVGGDKSSDIAVVKVADTEGLVAADIGDSDKLVVGQWVMTVGAPLGLEQSVATGIVSATNRSTIMDNSSTGDMYGYYFQNSTPSYTYYPNMIQTDAVINPGNSGGALVDADGKLIGINSMFSSYSGSYAGVGFAIPVNYAMGIAKDVIDGKEPTHAILGVSISQVNSQTANRYNLSVTKGAYIADITPDTGAAASDLQVGDVITAINGKSVTSTTDVTLDVREHNVGDTVTVTVDRNGKTLDIPVTLSSDENMSTSTEQSTPQLPEGYGDGSSDGSGGYTNEEMEYLLRLLGM